MISSKILDAFYTFSIKALKRSIRLYIYSLAWKSLRKKVLYNDKNDQQNLPIANKRDQKNSIRRKTALY